MGLLRKWHRLIHNTDCPTTKFIYRERKKPQCMHLILRKSHRRLSNMKRRAEKGKYI
jgi:hypothetical protein